jgi:mannose-6-phosphate isomerase-like protein (cupin superfamily)
VDDPIILGPGEGETIADERNRFIQLKAGIDRVALVELRWGAGEPGPARHVHREHADAFWVMSGELVVEVGAELKELTAGPETLVVVPPGVVHTFRGGHAGAHVLNLHAPSGGFHRQLRDRVAWDNEDEPEDPGLPASHVIVRGPGEGEELAMGESRATIKAGADDGGWLAVMDDVIAPGFPGPVPHRHAEMVDCFLVVDGTLTLLVGGGTVEAGAGSVAVVPPGHVHTFSNPGDAPVHLLNAMVPAGLEQYLKRVAAEAAGGPPDPARMAEIAADYDFEPASAGAGPPTAAAGPST